MKIMKLNLVALAVFTVLGLTSLQSNAGSCSRGAHKHEVGTEEAKGCEAKKGKACSTRKEGCEEKKACCGKEGCGEKETCPAQKGCDKAAK